MEEITAYRTGDGEEFLSIEHAKQHENKLKLVGFKEELKGKVLKDFEKELTWDEDEDGESSNKFFDEIPVYGGDLDYPDEFIDFAVDVVLGYDGKILKFINDISEEVIRLSK